MPTLSEILRDPNYINANEATKRAIFERHAPLDQNYSGANEATQFAIRQRFGVEGFGAPVAPLPVEKQSAFRQIADVPLGIAKGAVQGVRMIADAFGAGSDTSKTIKSAETYLADLMSAQAKNDQQEIARIMKDAEDKGVLDQVKAAVKAFTVAPIDTLSSALGTAAPVIAGALGAKVLGAGALLTTGVSALTGAGMGAGTIKGSIYEETKKTLKEAGASEQDAEARAKLAQEYGGKNLDQILLGTVLGGAAAVGPLEKGGAAILARRILGKTGTEATETVAGQAAKGAVRRRLEAGALEAVPEAVQAGQEQVATNIALQREGFDVPTFRGAVSSATLEGLAGAGLGATVGGGKRAPEVPPAPPVAPPAAEVPPVTPEQVRERIEEVTGVSRAAPPSAEESVLGRLYKLNDAEAEAAREELTQQRLLRQQEQIDAEAERVAELNRRQGMPSPDRPKLEIEERPSIAEAPPELTPREDLLAKQAEVDQRRLEAGLPTGEASATPGVQPTPEVAEEPKPVPKIVDERPLATRAAQNRLLVMRNMLQNQGGDPESLTVVPHPTVEGKFAIQSLDVPTKLTPELQGRKQVGPPVRTEPGKGLYVQSLIEQGELTSYEAQTFRERGEVRMRELPPSERAVELNAEDLAINGYVNDLKKINTPAAREFVRSYESGRFTREDVLIAVKAQRRMAEPVMLNFPKVGEKRYPIFVGPDGAQIKLAKPLVRNLIEKTISENEQQISRDVEAIEGGAKEELPTVQYKPRGESTLREQIISEGFVPPPKPEPPAPPVPPVPPTPPSDQPAALPKSAFELSQRLPSVMDKANVRKANEDGDIKKLVDSLKASPNLVTRRIGELGQSIANRVRLEKPGKLKKINWAGQFSYGPSGESIKMRPDHAGNEQVNAHEVVHALTVSAQLNPVTDKQKKFSQDIKDLYQHVKKELKKKGVTAYGLQDELEFTAEAMSNPDFQFELMQIPYPGRKNAWSKFVKSVADLLGITNTNALTQVMSLVEGIAETKAPRKKTTGVQTIGAEAEPTPPKGVAKIKAAAQKALQKQPMPEKGLGHVKQDLKGLAQPIFFAQNKTILDRIDGMKDRFWQRVAQNTADQFRTIKEYSPVGYMQARLSKSVDGGLEGLLFHGQVFDDGGALNIKAKTKGMVDILKPLGNELDSYLMWVALNRESRLPEAKRSKIPNMDQLVARRDEFSAGELNGKPRVEVYEDVLKQMNQLNKSVLDIALAKGLIDQKAYDKFSGDLYYIPFYKKMEEDGDISGAQTASGLTSQYFSKELKGGDKPFGDLMENVVRNWSHILSASMKNAAAKTTLDDAVELGAAVPNLKAGLEWKDGKVYSIKSGKPIEAKIDEDGREYAEGELRPDLTKQDAGMAKVMVDGQPMYFQVIDELLMDSISSIGYMGPKSKFILLMRDFKNMLQYGVTASPIFKVNNLIRDSVAAMAVSDLKKNPFANVIEGISLSKKDSPTYISALAGGAIFNFGSAYEGDQAKLIKRLLDQGVPSDSILDTKEKIAKGLKGAWDAYQHLGDRSEAANRLSLYQQLRDKGMTHLQASFMARDLLDFSMQGSWPAFRLLTQVVPFMNARIQGLYKLGRDGIIPTTRVLYNATTGKEIDANDKIRAAQFATITTAVMLASALLYLSFKDDEDFKKRDAWDRDNFWWIKLPGMDVALRVPKPFEVGAFGTLVERTLEQILDQGAEGKQFGESLGRTLWDTFSLNPTPQMFKPLIDIYANKDSFSGAPIESAGLERLSKQERATDQTSPLAIALGGITSIFPEKFQLSPVQMDYMLKGYFGWLGAMASVTSTYAVMPFKEGEYPDARWLDRASLGLARELPAPQSAYVTQFYNASKEISQAYADMRHYREMGDAEKVQEILEKQGDKIALAKFYDKTAKNIANIRKQIQLITNDKDMDGAEKKEAIERMKLIMSDLAKQAEEVRKSMK